MDLIEARMPDGPLDGPARNRRYRANSADKYYASRARYRHNNSKWQTDADYLSRPFIAWDGEGVSLDSGEHLYTMLAVKGDNIDTDIHSDTGLKTVDIFETLLEASTQTERGIHIIYGGSYDANMWLSDLTRADLWPVYKYDFALWRNYRIGWRPGKQFYLAEILPDGSRGRHITVYDIVSFFQCGFVSACDSYLGDRFTERDMIVANKAARGSFQLEDMATVRKYNDAELSNLILLADELRERLNAATLRPRRWIGPGAVAAALMQRERVKASLKECPPKVAKAGRYAYAGGRFEAIRYGHVEAPAYEYDLNSAYPAALVNVPDLSKGSWEYVSGDPGPQPFAVYHLHWKYDDMAVPGPLFRRDPNGTVVYPLTSHGWYWTPEYESTKAFCDAGWGEFAVSEAWVFRPWTENKPFAFLNEMYRKRQILKAAGDGAHVAYKLGYNSIYGKLCEQVSAKQQPDGSWRLPPYHRLEIAGYVTSSCRAAMIKAALPKLQSVIAFETDAVFTSEPLDVPVSTELGEFEMTEFTDLTYVQSGLYFGNATDGKSVAKTRGIDRGYLTRDMVLRNMFEPTADDRECSAPLTRFNGAGIALSQRFDKWRRWETMTKTLTLEPVGKRCHMGCDACDANGPRAGEWHETMCPLMNNAMSSEFPIMWINPDPSMSELDEMRRFDVDFEYESD